MNNTNIHTQTTVHKDWNPASAGFDYSFEFAFITKAQYQEFRRHWKENYATLSASLRRLKSDIKDVMRKQEYAGKLQSELHSLRSEASMQIQMRRASKEESNRHYLAARQTPA